MIEVAERSDVAVDTAPLAAVLRAVCAELRLPNASVGLMIVTPAEMASMNESHRRRATPTDVLSFPIDGEDGLEALRAWPPDGPPPELGDIVICPDAASDDLATLVVHGLLHLVGFDHENDDGEMLALQDRLVAEILD